MNILHRLAALCVASLLGLAIEPQSVAAQQSVERKASARTQATRTPGTQAPTAKGSRTASAPKGTRTAVPAQAVKALQLPAAGRLDEPPADATEVSLAAQSLRSGCLTPQQDLRAALQAAAISDETLIAQIQAHSPDLLESTSTGCLPFMLSMGAQQRLTSFSVLQTRAEGEPPRLISFERRGTGVEFEVSSQPLPDALHAHRKVDIALEQILSDRGRALAGTLPASLERQVHYLARAFQDQHQLSPASLVRVVYEDAPASGADSGNQTESAESGKARLLGMRFFDRDQVRDFGSAVWIDRDDLPGGFFTTGGVDAERMFWSSPIDHVKISRGVGSFKYTRTVRQSTRQGDRTVKVAKRVSGWTHHQGVDFAAPTGTPVHAVADGKVLMAAFYGGYGNLIILEHAGGYSTYYAHLSAYAANIETGATVRRGDEIGAVGSTGRSTGPHLHFELRRNKVYIDPLAPGRNLDLWTLRDRDQRELARRSVVMTAITDPARATQAIATQSRATSPDRFPQTQSDLQTQTESSPPMSVGDRAPAAPAAPTVLAAPAQPEAWGAPIVNLTSPE